MPLALVLLLSSVVFISLKGQRVLSTLFGVELGATPFEMGILFAMNGLFPSLLAVSAGRIADRLDNRILMYAGIAGYSACLMLPVFFPTLGALYVAVAFSGLSSMVFVIGTQHLLGVLSSAKTRTRNFSYYSLGESAAAIVGPVSVGFAIDAFRFQATYLYLSLFTAGCALILAAAHRRVPPGTRDAGDNPGPRRMADLLKLPAMRNALLTNGVVMSALDLFNLYMPVYARGLGLNASTIGLIIGAFGAAGIVTRLAIPPITGRWGERTMLLWSLALAAAAFALVPLTTSALLLGVIAFFIGLGLGCGQPLSMVLAYNAAPKGRQAEGIAMRLAVSYGSHLVIPPLFGAFGAVLGLSPVFWTCGVLLTTGSWLNRRPAEKQN
ncbi:MAG: MFS transporter [Burkholderiales bacterium]